MSRELHGGGSARAPRRLAPAAAVALALLSAAPPAQAVDVLFVGGMALAVRPMSPAGPTRPLPGVGLGINGRVMMLVGDHLRLRVGVVTGALDGEDRTHLDRTLVAGAVEAVHWLGHGFYATVGSRLGGEHLVMIETQETDEAGTRIVRDLDEWRLCVEPFTALGLQLRGRYHFELETGVALTVDGDRVEVSYLLLLGVYFRMGVRHGSGGGPG